ncbi:hypothetical protein K435DRAFT_811340 [Dendrothele bispora CBS 962.96]|uniref:Uncharacterized protein n=1 Tax=Dendrothele bispora (strain CBS 962.96) TaxID=1314807 RepID=A0A4S8KSM2_DENBC|nr:hypothetical protein K435DRAFT_811340 [Dendrothele bispora CBS 962.96]
MSRSFYKKATNCTFNGKIFNVVGNLNFMGNSGSEDQIVSHGARGESIFDEVGSLKTGLCAFHLQYEYLSEVNEEIWWPERLNCTKTTYKIDLLGQGHKEATSALPYRIAVRYTGKDAYAVWEQDFVKYSNQHPNFVHLYGFNGQKSSPSLIFCDNVVPFMQVWEDCSSIVKLHIHYSLTNAVFIRCDTGEICFGSQGPSKKRPSDLELLWQGHDGLRQKLIGSFKNLDQSYSYTLEPWICGYNYVENGKLLGTGWTQFYYESYIGKEFRFHVNCSHEATQRICNAWFHQKQYYLNEVNKDAFGRFGKQILFLKKDWCPESGSTEARWLTNGRDHYFWSFDPSGSIPLSRGACNTLGLPKYRTSISSMVHNLFDYQYEAAEYLQEIQRFDPLTQDYTRACGLPLFEMFSPLEHFHLNDLTEEDQGALDAWSDAKETLSNMSDSESVYKGASSQLQTIPFPIPSAEQRLNWTTPEILEDPDLECFEGDVSLNEESDDLVSRAFGIGIDHSLGLALITGCRPSLWLDAYLIEENITSWMDFVGDLKPASRTLVLKGYTPFVGFVPTVSIWMIDVNKQWKKIGVAIIVGSATDIRSRSSTYNSENVVLPSKY